MEEFVNFLLHYYREIILGISIVLEIVILIIKKRPKTIDDLEKALSDVSTMLPDLINSVEVPGNGYEKKKKVIDIAFKTFKSVLGRDVSVSEADLVQGCFSRQIETILSTPQKKGVKNEK